MSSVATYSKNSNFLILQCTISSMLNASTHLPTFNRNSLFLKDCFYRKLALNMQTNIYLFIYFLLGFVCFKPALLQCCVQPEAHSGPPRCAPLASTNAFLYECRDNGDRRLVLLCFPEGLGARLARGAAPSWSWIGTSMPMAPSPGVREEGPSSRWYFIPISVYRSWYIIRQRRSSV